MRGKLIALTVVLLGLMLGTVGAVQAPASYYVCHITASPWSEPHYNYLVVGNLNGHFYDGDPSRPKHGEWSWRHWRVLYDFVTVAGDTDCDGAGPVPTATTAPTATTVPTATLVPTAIPTEIPTDVPTAIPTEVPTEEPTPTSIPTDRPTDEPIPTEVPPIETEEPPTEGCVGASYHVWLFQTDEEIGWYFRGGECQIYTRGYQPSTEDISRLCDVPCRDYRYDGRLVGHGVVEVDCYGNVTSQPRWLYRTDAAYAFGTDALYGGCDESSCE